MQVEEGLQFMKHIEGDTSYKSLGTSGLYTAYIVVALYFHIKCIKDDQHKRQ
jgi:hypothetical protein